MANGVIVAIEISVNGNTYSFTRDAQGEYSLTGPEPTTEEEREALRECHQRLCKLFEALEGR